MYVLQQGTYRIVRLKNYTNKKVVFGGLGWYECGLPVFIHEICLICSF